MGVAGRDDRLSCRYGGMAGRHEDSGEYVAVNMPTAGKNVCLYSDSPRRL